MTEWRNDIKNAPFGEPVLTYGAGGISIKILDDLGNWRGRHHRPLGTPTHWMLLPDPPKQDEPNPFCGLPDRFHPRSLSSPKQGGE